MDRTWITYLFTASLLLQLGGGSIVQEATCLDRFGSLPVERFNRRACVMCFGFLFPLGKQLEPWKGSYEHLESSNGTIGPIAPDGVNTTLMEQVCETLNTDECERWWSCCTTAVACCQQQLEVPRIPLKGSCPRTWDGYTCYGNTHGGTIVESPCPSYLAHSLTTRKSIKICNNNGTWYRKGGREWTNYKPCLDKQGYITGVYISLGCSAASIILLVPAVIIFLAFRDLRRQHRVKLHVNFFMSLALCGLAGILWFRLVHYDLLVNPVSTETVMYSNPVWCQVLSFFKIYLTATTYVWMFCEGYYLHRLISNAFEPPKNLIVLYLVGWGVPLLPAVVYGILRGVIGNDSCWAKNIGHYQWIIYIPNLFCLSEECVTSPHLTKKSEDWATVELHHPPAQSEDYLVRRGLKAAFMLVPLFGLQLLLTIYRPPADSSGATWYEYITQIVTNSQGVFVALIFCFFNGEVLAHIAKYLPCCRLVKIRRGRFSSTNMTQVTMTYGEETTHRSPPGSFRGRTPSHPSVKNGHTHVSWNNMEMEDYPNPNGPASRGAGSRKGQKCGYMPLSTSVVNEAANI